MKESDAHGRAGEERGRLLPGVPPSVGRAGGRNAPQSAERKADDEWLEFATEDPAFFIKPSDAV
jgi:hypothetical protein